jgi:hypothetical protein
VFGLHIRILLLPSPCDSLHMLFFKLFCLCTLYFHTIERVRGHGDIEVLSSFLVGQILFLVISSYRSKCCDYLFSAETVTLYLNIDLFSP